MTPKTSDVAVCCSSAWLRSRVFACTSSNNRVFSMAMTAWSAKVWKSSICLSVKGCDLGTTDRECANRRPLAAAKERRELSGSRGEVPPYCHPGTRWSDV